MSSTSLRKERRRSTVSRSVFPTPTSRTSRAGATRAAVTGVVAATPGSFPTKQSSGATNERPHPATFPVQLATNCILLHGLTRAQRMLDPFLGIGNSAVAAKRCCLTKLHRLRNRRRISARGPAQARSGHTPRVLYPGEFSENFASGLTRLPGRGRTRSKIRAASGFAIG